jgi:cell division protein FtsQ
VTGNHETRVADILRAAAIDRGRPMVSVDTRGAVRRIERLPWVDRVTVGRSWPSTVKVRVTERTPVAAVRITDQQSAVVDAGGRILAIEPAAATPATGAGAPVVITGVGGTLAEGGRLPAGARDALAIAVAVRQRLPGVVASVGTNRDLTLTDGGIVRFGSADQLQDKVTALQTVLDQVDTHCLRTLDVRVPGSPALTRNGGCS